MFSLVNEKFETDDLSQTTYVKVCYNGSSNLGRKRMGSRTAQLFGTLEAPGVHFCGQNGEVSRH